MWNDVICYTNVCGALSVELMKISSTSLNREKKCFQRKVEIRLQWTRIPD